MVVYEIANCDAIINLEIAQGHLRNVRDFLKSLDTKNIIECFNLIEEATKIAKKAYWELSVIKQEDPTQNLH